VRVIRVAPLGDSFGEWVVQNRVAQSGGVVDVLRKAYIVGVRKTYTAPNRIPFFRLPFFFEHEAPLTS
jgi:hypothetical protein